MKKIAIVMAGGMGERFWPRSTESKPKQFLHLIGEGTMIQNTVMRLMPLFKPEEIFIVALENVADIIYEQLPAIPHQNVIVEPFQKNTAPCIALTCTQLSNEIEDDTVIHAFPADHVIYNVREFHQSLELAATVASSRDGIVIIGVMPTRPEPQYGYVQIKNESGDLGELFDSGVRYSTTFAEKPDVETALRFLNSGDFLWNSGIFTMTAGIFWKSLETFLPEHFRLFKVLKKDYGTERFDDSKKNLYMQMQSESMDYGILEKADNVYVIESSFTWSDLGTWDELYRLSMKDARNNIIEGDVIPINTSNCLISSKGRLIGAVGVDDLVIIDSDKALLVCKKGKTDNVKEIVDFMKRKNITNFL
jgi:mannose-1-phosphate guanylyltransferase